MILTNYIVLIPARAGSKRIKDKNLLKIGGRSLLQRSIDVATKIFPHDQVYLSTDSIKLAQIGEGNGVLIHRRNHSSATDSAVANDVLKDFIDSSIFTNRDKDTLSIVYLQPTSPFRDVQDIEACLRLHEDNSFRPVISVRNNSISLQKSLKQEANGYYYAFASERNTTANSQLFSDNIYIPNGAIYIFRLKHFLERNTFPVNESVIYKMDDFKSLDIDFLYDASIAEQISISFGW